MPIDYDKIRADNILEYGQGTRHLSFLGRLYTDRTHFIFELLQNAEDAGASKVLFQLFKDKLEVFHDGRLFDEKDVRGICGVGEGTKTEDFTQIGKFGIGFKSVYAYTSTPEVHSGHENFRIENYVRPYAVRSRDIGYSWTTLFAFPFDKEEVEPEIAGREISARLRKLSVRTLLFLRKIKEIEYRLPDGVDGVYLRDEAIRGGVREVTVIGQNNGEDESESWLIFERPVELPDPREYGPDKVPVEIALRLEKDDMGKMERIIKVKESTLVVYFPTEKETRFGFLIQGPYKTTPARDNIPKDDGWNRTLVRETASLIADVLTQLKDLGLLDFSLLEALPIRSIDFPADGMFYPIFKSVREALKTKELLPTDDDNFVSAQSAKIASADWLRRLLRQEQFNLIFQKEIKWISGEITETGRYSDLWKYIRQELDVEELTPDSFARKIDKPFLTEQSNEWFTQFYGHLLGIENLWRPPKSSYAGGLLRSKPIIRLQDDNQVIPFRADGTTPNAFLPPPEDTDFPVVKRSIAIDESARDFLIRLGLSEPNVFDDIVEKVLPKYTQTGGDSISDAEHQTDIRKIVSALGSDSEAGKIKVIQAAGRTPFLKATNSSGETAFKKPADIYLNTLELRRYFSTSETVWFLHDGYSSSDIDVWRDLGVSSLPRKLLISDFPPHINEHSNYDPEVKNYDLDGLEHFLNAITEISDFEGQKRSATVLWDFLRDYLKQDARFFKATYKWLYYTWRGPKYFNSKILDRLKNSKWIPIKNGTLEKPNEITTDQILDEFGGATELCEGLGIVEGTDQGEEERKLEHATELGVSLEDIEILKNYRDEFERFKAALAARREHPTFPTRPVANPERRQERLSEQLSNAPDKEYGKRKRSVRTTNDAIDPATWLRNQYTNKADQMVCQICKKEMPFRKRDGAHYFEKKEVLSRKYLPKEHEAQYLALCPLCAAMYEEFVKSDDNAMADLRNKLVSTVDCDVPIMLGDQETSIRFVETHHHDLKVIIDEAE